MLRAFVEFHLEYYRILQPLFGNDIETVYLAQALILRAGPLAFRPPGPGDDGQLAGMAIASSVLAQKLNLPRETVRRKILLLMDDGVAERAESGETRLRFGVMAEPRFQAMIDAMASVALRFLNRCLREDYIAVKRIGPGGETEILAPDARPSWRVVDAGRPDSRQLLIQVFARLFVDIYLVRAHLYERDIQQAILTDAVGLFAVEDYYHSPDLRGPLGSIKVLLWDRQKGASVRWLVDQTGLPRETVRRKLRRLVEREHLAETEDGRYIFKPGLFQDPDIVAGVQEIERLIVDFMDRSLQLGIFTLVRGDGTEAEV